MNKLIIVLSLVMLVACGKAEKIVYVNTPATTVETTDVIKLLVELENEWRLSQGQTVLSPGLTCSVQQVSSGQYLSTANGTPGAGQASMVLTGTKYMFLGTEGFNQPDSNAGTPNMIIPSSIRSLFLNNNYKINCAGFLVVEHDGHTPFQVSSDDGSILTVDGSVVINNDGNHSIVTKSGSKLLRRGVKSFNLAYAQTGGGKFGLVLKMDGEVIPGSRFYH